ncbi:hypothetical protein [Nissabacter sp. SGAir0207]|uniref:hypothetical protein n=1 Tax=Nissabacter sp. SGAir0207 TaxID=2126321 RepID=UPI0010CCFC5F|nr:hypothetical protein [Nissabacter sp. SGAir0207]QCR37984.1 hypothetical protein C1N62_17740 [Nissabacter sp. SGAir0207]
MKIACLGWGSLIWKPGPLPVAGEWRSDGPEVPVEFSRVGDSGELSTAVSLNAPLLQVFWAELAVEGVDQAIAALREREGIPEQRHDGVGALFLAASPVGPLAEWALARDIDVVIWTALPPRIHNIEGRIPSSEEAVAYLSSLTGETREHAMNYLEQVPAQLDTPYRRAIKAQLGWG